MFSLLRKVIPVLVTGVLVLSLIACSPSPKAAAEEGIVIVIAEDPPSFNPAIADTGYDYLVMELVMLGLADVDPQGNIFPELAAEIPSLENGGVVINEEDWTMQVTWKLRQDVQWADGKPVTADDVIFARKQGRCGARAGGASLCGGKDDRTSRALLHRIT